MRTNDKRRIEKGEMRNRFFGSAIFLLSAFSFLLFISCDKQEIESFDSQKDTPITIASAGVTELTTRAITNDQLVGTATEPVTMSVFVIDGSLDKYKANNMKWEHRGEEWQSSGAATVYFAGVNSIQKIYALSPYVEGATDGIVTITADGKTDYLVAERTKLITNVASLTMTHALSKLVLKPTFGTEVTNQTITSVEVGGMYASGTLKISDNTWTLSDNPATTKLTMTNNELLVIPMVGTSFPIVITMEDGRKFTTDISLAQVSNQLAPGTQYNISLQVGQDKVTLGGITASSWESVDGGQLETM